MAEWFKAHAWKVCVLSKVPWVRIPLSPPFLKLYLRIFKKYKNNKNNRLLLLFFKGNLA